MITLICVRYLTNIMEIHADLHSHSIFAGGAGSWKSNTPIAQKKMKKRFLDAAKYSPLKGINFLGTGDCQFKPWMKFLQKNLEEVENGVYEYQISPLEIEEPIIKDTTPIRYLLQTEVIFTAPSPRNKKRKKKAHTLLLFPNFQLIGEFNTLLDKFKVSHQNMARPFLVNDSVEELEDKLHQILDLDSFVEVIPAHIMTPEGVYGSNLRINYLEEFFGSTTDRISAIETGLSADPKILGLIPELDNKTLISNADAHSAGLNRVGRESTTFELNKFNYTSIIDAIRNNKVVRTIEFHPSEGRYFLTGHRENRKKPGVHLKNQFCYYSPNFIPENDLCPICNKELTVGVLQRAFEISSAQTEGNTRSIGEGPARNFISMVPLVEIIAHSLNIKSVNSKSVFRHYMEVIDKVGSEVKIWTTEEEFVDNSINQNIICNINKVKQGNFCFTPLGYDGTYGELQIGETINFNQINVISR